MFDVVKQKKLEKRYNNIIQKSIPQHLGIILDGNGRWAKKRKMPRIMGHAMGIKRIEAIIPEVRKLGIQTLTLFAFSTENWNRPQEEVDFLMNEAKKLYERLINRIDELEYNVRVIGEGVFANNRRLSNVTISAHNDGLTIDKYAFANCETIDSFSIYGKIANIDNDAFMNTVVNRLIIDCQKDPAIDEALRRNDNIEHVDWVQDMSEDDY